MGIHYNASIVADNSLILALDAKNPKSYPGTGQLWKDLSGKGNDFTLLAETPTYNPIPGSISMTPTANTDEAVRTTGINGLPPGDVTALSWMAFVRITDAASTRLWSFDDLGTDNTGRLNHYLNASTNRLQWELNNVNSGAVNLNTTVLNSWMMVGSVIDGNQIQVYCGLYSKGLLQFEPIALTSTPLVGSHMLIGRRGLATDAMGGDVGAFLMWNRPLSMEEMHHSFSAYRERYGL